MSKIRSVALLVLVLLLLTTAGILAATNPATFFTDNMASTGTSPAVTPMEQALLDRINSAVTSIDAAFYDFNRDSIRDALIAAHTRGVTVRVVTDDETRLFIDSYIPYYQALETAGISLMDDGRDQSIMHNKYFIIDGQIVWTGSVNQTDNGYTLNHNNALVFTSTTVANFYQQDFNQMWAGNFSVNKTASTTTTTTYNGQPLEVYFSPKDDAIDEVIAEVNAAQTSIEFAIFFFTDDNLKDALIAAKNRGVQIRGLWDNLGMASPFSEDEALCAANIPIKIEDTVGKMHHKFMVIDAAGSDPRVVTGSMNWTGAGNDSNDENTVIYRDSAVASAYTAGFQTMWEALDESTQCTPPPAHTLFLPLVLRPGDGDDPPPPTPADIQLVTIVYNPDGLDSLGEYVELRNAGGNAQDMTDWTLRDEANHIYTFPKFSLAAGASVKVWVTNGTDTSIDLYWNQGSAIWNNGGDTAYLEDNQGTEIDVCTYPGGGTEANCQ